MVLASTMKGISTILIALTTLFPQLTIHLKRNEFWTSMKIDNLKVIIIYPIHKETLDIK